MTFALSTYITLNILVSIGALISFGSNFFKKSSAQGSLLKREYITITMIFGFTFLSPVFPSQYVFQPAIKMWSADSIRSFSVDYEGAKNNGFLSVPGTKDLKKIRSDSFAIASAVLFMTIAMLSLVKLVLDLLKLFRIQQESFLYRRIGKVSVYSHAGIAVPFSFAFWNRAYVILPQSIFATPDHFRISMAHEIQHHRQKDTTWIYAIWFLQLICIFNPLIYLWRKTILELQEFACDEALLRKRKVDSKAYASCLFEVAKSVLHQKRNPACATGLTFLVERNLIHRRVDMMLNESTKRYSKQKTLAFCAILAAIMSTTTYAAKSLVQDRRVNMAQAQEMVENAKKGSEFPIVVNELVLAQLNRYLGTPEGRNFMRESLQRMESYRAMIGSKLEEYDLPIELMAVPIVETGYRNIEERNIQSWGAGVWSFIKSTARAYGLKVNSEVDERLNVELLTDAAMRYFKANNLRFKDWLLSSMAYNMGENAVQKAMDKEGTRDAWELIRKGHEGDKDYLAKVMAAILIMKNPSVLR